MSILWMDGFEHYGNGTTGRDNMTLYGAYASSSGVTSTTYARTGTYSYRLGNGDNLQFRRTFGTTKSSVGYGCAFYCPTLPTNNNSVLLATFLNNAGISLISIMVNPTGFIEVWNASTSTSGSQQAITTSQVVQPGTWHHFECFFTPNGSSSSIEVRVDEITVIDDPSIVIGLDNGTGATSTETSSVRATFASVLSYSFYVDDIYAWDTSGSYNNDFLGDKRVATLFPNGDTAEADWTPNSGATGYTQIDELSPDGDTSYVTSSTAGDISEYDFEAMPSNAIGITGVQIYTLARKTDAGACDIRTDIVSGSYSSSGETQTCTTAYTTKLNTFETDPNTGALWTRAAVDAAKIRLEREV